MKLGRIVILLSLLIMLLSGSSILFAQEGDSALLQMLALVPDAPHGDLYFNDFAAVEQAYPPAQVPANWDEFETLTSDTADELFPLDVWWRVFFNFQAPFLNYFMSSADMPAAMGIDFFQINRSLYNMLPPQTVAYLHGDFDVEVIQFALTQRGFSEQSTVDDFQLWCGEVGCENSDQANLADRNIADLFGGDLGRQWARLVSPDLLIGANQFEDLQAVSSTLTGEDQSLADNPVYQAAAEAVSDQGVLLQAFIMSDSMLESFGDPLALIDPRMTSAQIAALYSTLLEDGFEELPAFELLLLADLVSEKAQVAQVVLVYEDQAAAAEAARIVPERIDAYQSVVARRSLTEILEDRRIESVTAEIVESNGMYAVRVTFVTPKATAEEIVQLAITNTDPPDVTAPGLVYRLFMQGYAARDLGWLSTVTREEIEALAGN